MWAGLAVNDLSSAIAVGSQFGEVGLTFATIAKGLRICTLAPWLICFGLRAAGRTANGRNTSFCATLWSNFPLFMVLFSFLFAVRAVLDCLAVEASIVKMVSGILRQSVNFIMVMVCAGIGLRTKLDQETLRACWRYTMAEAAASIGLSALSLLMLEAFTAISSSSVRVIGLAVAFLVGVLAIAASVCKSCRPQAGRAPPATVDLMGTL